MLSGELTPLKASDLLEETTCYYIKDDKELGTNLIKGDKFVQNVSEEPAKITFNNNYGVSSNTLQKIQELNAKIVNFQQQKINSVLQQQQQEKSNAKDSRPITAVSQDTISKSFENNNSKKNDIKLLNSSLSPTNLLATSSATLSSESLVSKQVLFQEDPKCNKKKILLPSSEMQINNCNNNYTMKSGNNLQPNNQSNNNNININNNSNNNSNNNNNGNNINNNINVNDSNGRSAALERAYVHDVYQNCEEPTGPIRPKVAQFLSGLDPGSIVCDVGCGNGRYLTACNPYICTVGVDRCFRLAKVAKEKGGEVTVCDNLELPFRDESFDAVLSLAVVHHFATTERRVGAIQELARILRIGGRVIITVWALEQRHRRFESQDVLIPWQPPKNRTINYSDEEDEDDYLPPYHAYTEDSTNSSRSAGDGDSSSLSSSSPGESCYSFVRKAIQKLAGGRKHPWFLESWNSKETKNDSSLDYEDAKDLPIELRRLEDFEDFPDPPLSAGLKSRSLGSILNPPPRQIVRSRSSVPSLGGIQQNQQQQVFYPPETSPKNQLNNSATSSSQPHLLGMFSGNSSNSSPLHSSNMPNASPISVNNSMNISPTKSVTNVNTSSLNNSSHGTPILQRRPKLIKQKQSLCDEDFQLPETQFNLSTSQSQSNSNNSLNNIPTGQSNPVKVFQKQISDSKLFLRKQSSLNEELMAGNRLREKERVRKRIQKQMSLNEAFLCRSMFTKRLQIIREGFTTKLKTSTGSLERVTKSGFVKIMKNIQQAGQFGAASSTGTTTNTIPQNCPNHQYVRSMSRKSSSCQNHNLLSSKQAMQHCIAAGTHSTVGMCSNCNNGSGGSGGSGSSSNNSSNEDQKTRRHSRESGSDSSKDSSLQSDTSIESEDSFASVIYIPKPENVGCNCSNSFQHQQQQIYHNHKYSSNSSSGSNGTSNLCDNGKHHQKPHCVPTSPLIMPCPPTPAHSPAALNCNNPSAGIQIVGGMLLSPPNLNLNGNVSSSNKSSAGNTTKSVLQNTLSTGHNTNAASNNRFTFDDEHIEQQKNLQEPKQNQLDTKVIQDVKHLQGQRQLNPMEKKQEIIEGKPKRISLSPPKKITRQSIKDLPPIPKFRKTASVTNKPFPIVRRSTVAAPNVPKLMSLELFNPATDDLDSDSSEPSSPDSIDSVINTSELADLDKTKNIKATNKTEIASNVKNVLQQSQSLDETKRNRYSNDAEVFTKNVDTLSCNIDTTLQLNTGVDRNLNITANQSKSHQELVDFAEQLSAQLLKHIDDKPLFDRTLSQSPPPNQFTEETCQKGKNKETKDLTDWREELRERRLNLANLSTQPSQQQSPISSSTSSLSSQTRSFTIQEEDEEHDGEASYLRSNAYYDQKHKNVKYNKKKINQICANQNNNVNDYRYYSINPETAFLIEDIDDDEDDEIQHNVIIEEDEDELRDDEDDDDEHNSKRTSRNTIRCQDSNESPLNDNPVNIDPNWVHSNSSNSLDSPSQSGGSTTHHRYYHVFREGELDALINHHVTSLHIVSSYYERASWCVVAEKVQVWTI